MQYSESGHAKNAANFGSIIQALQALGTQYNPSAVEIRIPALLSLKTNLDNALAAVRTAEAPYKNAVNTRQSAFEVMSKLTTRMTDSLEGCGATPKEIKDGLGMSKKIKGARVKSNLATTESSTKDNTIAIDEVEKHSVSQMSFDNRVENFKQLVTYLSSIPKYIPNEADLKVASLSTYVNGLPTLNNNVNATHNTLNNVRITRDKLLYTPLTGAYDLSLQIKSYVKSIYGSSSPEYKNISKLKLKDRANK